MAGYTYTTYVLALRTMVVSNGADTAFTDILPSCIDYAEQRIYRELNLHDTTPTDTSVTLVTGTRTATIPDTFVAVNSISVLTPAGASGSAATRVPLDPVSIDVVNTLWPSGSITGVPKMFAMSDQWGLILGPSPDAAYGLEVVGTYRPPALSASNTTTFISERLPDLFLAASMVFLSGYMRNFGAQASDPAMSSSWETQYQLLKASADLEELRKHMWAASWTSQPVSPAAQPQRG
jgi:hypothetical protein